MATCNAPHSGYREEMARRQSHPQCPCYEIRAAAMPARTSCPLHGLSSVTFSSSTFILSRKTCGEEGRGGEGLRACVEGGEREIVVTPSRASRGVKSG